MTKKSKKISSYLSAAAAILGANTAYGQFQYTDIDDTTIVNGLFELDLDGDTVVDFTIEHVLNGGQLDNVTSVLLRPGDSIDGNLALGAARNSFNYVDNAIPGTVLNSNSVFFGINPTIKLGYMAFLVDGVAYPNSNWAGPVTDGYLGLRILKNDSACYGWLRLDVADSAKSITIKDWSFNPEKDTSFTVAYELLDVMDNILKNMVLTNDGNSISLKTDQPIGLTAYDIHGKELYKARTRSLHNINTLNWTPGVHILRIEGDKWYHNLKVLIP